MESGKDPDLSNELSGQSAEDAVGEGPVETESEPPAHEEATAEARSSNVETAEPGDAWKESHLGATHPLVGRAGSR